MDTQFLEGIKCKLIFILNSHNKTVEEYVESIVKKDSGVDNISILQKGQIISRLNDILFYEDKQSESKVRKKYRYK